MRVKFIHPFFAPGDPFKRTDGREVKGRLYDPGEYFVPNDMKLPKSAEILDKEALGPELPIPARNPIHEVDGQRAASDAVAEATKKAEETRDENMQKKRGRGRPKKYE